MAGRPATTVNVFGRAVLTSAVLWTVGGLLVQGVFTALDRPTLITLGDGIRRGQAVWLGAQCLAAALAIAIATFATFSAVDFSDPRAGRLRTSAACGLVLALGMAVVTLAFVVLHLHRTLAGGLAGAIVIGALCGLGIVWWRADPGRPVGSEAVRRTPIDRGGQAWGSRGR